MINDISEEKSISENLKQLLSDNLLKQSMINKIFKDSTINNKESMINDVLSKKTVDNNENTINNNDNKKTINNNFNTFVETPMCNNSKRAVLNPKVMITSHFNILSHFHYIIMKLVIILIKYPKVNLIPTTLIGIILIFHQ